MEDNTKKCNHNWYIAFVFRSFFDANVVEILFKCDYCDEVLEKSITKEEVLND